MRTGPVIAGAWRLGVVLALWAQARTVLAQPPGGGPPPALVTLGEARLEEIEQVREVTGELRAARRSVLASEEEGRVVAVLVEPGDAVEEGQPLARLEDTHARLELERARATLATRGAAVHEMEEAVAKSRRDLELRQRPYQAEALTETEIADARTAVAAAEARLEQARAELAWAEADVGRAQKRLADMVVEAPFRSRVVIKRTEVGQWLTRGGPVVELIQLDSVDAWLDVPERFIAALGRPGAMVQLRVTATGEVRTAAVAGIVPEADPLSRLFPVRVRLENRDEALKAGMGVVGLVPAGEKRATLTVPKDAILRNDAGAYVYANLGGTAQIVRVEPLFGAGDRLALRSERLAPGMQVVVEGNERLFPGQPLIPAGGPGAGPGGGPPTGGPDGRPAGTARSAARGGEAGGAEPGVRDATVGGGAGSTEPGGGAGAAR